MSNRLINESSPYLRQHANNPVNWYPWDQEAFEIARAKDRPILLSIGYSACHWCHVMEHESFESQFVADLMNRHFVSIKVDREERPDVDEIYMTAVQLITGAGGWPMTMFLLPDLRPFYGGTYYPPEDRYGRPGFPRILERIAEMYANDRQKIEDNAVQICSSLNRSDEILKGDHQFGGEILENAFHQYTSAFDPTHGGFGTAPKFPSSMALSLLLRYHGSGAHTARLDMVESTLKKMARGGIYDQLGGGFHRYSVDERWLVPHFEKMLYDNALLAWAYCDAFQVTGNDFYLQIVGEVLDYVLREMTQPRGGFYATQDADSEGVEGKFFVWDPAEVRKAVGERDAPVVMRYFDVTEEGNFEDGKTILHVMNEAEKLARFLKMELGDLHKVICQARATLFAYRSRRTAPFLDEKVITSWNGLMISAMAKGFQISGREEFLVAAQQAAAFILSEMKSGDQLLHVYKDGRARLAGLQDDYSSLVVGLLDLFEADFNNHWLESAAHLNQTMVERFWDEQNGGFFYTEAGESDLIVRTKSMFDNAVPSGNSMAVFGLLRLAALTGKSELYEKAERTLRAFGKLMSESPTGCSHMIGVLEMFRESITEIAIVGEGVEKANMLRTIHRNFLPNKIVVTEDATAHGGLNIPLLEGKITNGLQVAAFVCRHQACSAPISNAAELEKYLFSDRAASNYL